MLYFYKIPRVKTMVRHFYPVGRPVRTFFVLNSRSFKRFANIRSSSFSRLVSSAMKLVVTDERLEVGRDL